MTYTKGPWEARIQIPDGHIITREGTWSIWTPEYDVCTGVPGGEPIRKESDARLIAAAPELLEALRVVVDYYVPKFAKAPEAVAAREAIAKAEGR